MARLRKTYDRILIDTSALTSSFDALSLARFADGIALVVRPDNIFSMDELGVARDVLMEAALPVLGLIVNGSKEKDGSGVDKLGLAAINNGWFYQYTPKVALSSSGNGTGSAQNHAIAVGTDSVSSNGRLRGSYYLLKR